jgi:WD40 repeat protein
LGSAHHKGQDKTMAAPTKAKLKQRIKQARLDVEQLHLKVNDALEKQAPSLFSRDASAAPAKLKKRRSLKGHFGKVVSVDWLPDSTHLVTAAQDCNVILWHAPSGRKAYLLPLKNQWAMFACCASDASKLCATGGLDNVCTVWTLPEKGEEVPTPRVLEGHKGHVAAATFLATNTLITVSGDATAALWDLNASASSDIDQRTEVFEGHDQCCSSVARGSAKNFATASADGSVMLWSLGEKVPNCILRPHRSDLKAGSRAKHPDANSVAYQTDRTLGVSTESFGTFLFDARTSSVVNKFGCEERGLGPKTSCAFSSSGRLLFVGTEEHVEVWDTLQGDAPKPLQKLQQHGGRVTSLEVPASGQCVACASWDFEASVLSV